MYFFRGYRISKQKGQLWTTITSKVKSSRTSYTAILARLTLLGWVADKPEKEMGRARLETQVREVRARNIQFFRAKYMLLYGQFALSPIGVWQKNPNLSLIGEQSWQILPWNTMFRHCIWTMFCIADLWLPPPPSSYATANHCVFSREIYALLKCTVKIMSQYPNTVLLVKFELPLLAKHFVIRKYFIPRQPRAIFPKF